MCSNMKTELIAVRESDFMQILFGTRKMIHKLQKWFLKFYLDHPYENTTGELKKGQKQE